MHISQLGEFQLIEQFKKQLPNLPAGSIGIGDDAAVLPSRKGFKQLITTDMLVERVHFTRRMNPKHIGHKALAVNISDIAAMGGLPKHAVVSIGLPAALEVRFAREIYQGMSKLARRFNVGIVGGDTVRSNNIIINVALVGEVEDRYLTLRSGARPKEWIFVTGYLGGSLASGRHLTFMPRLECARFLVENFKPSAMMDISDGLGGDLNHILKQSKVGASLWPDLVPINRGCTLQQAMSDGEDFELLFTLDPAKVKKLMAWQEKNRAWHFYPVGIVTSNQRQLIKSHGYTHFSQ